MTETSSEAGSTPAPDESEFPDLNEIVKSEAKFAAADPARIAARCLLTRALNEAGTTVEQAGRDGSICLVVLPDECWTGVARDEWQSLARSGQRYDGGERNLYGGNNSKWMAWAPEEEPRPSVLEDGTENLARAVARGRHCIGFTSEPSWLPSDLVFAADHRLAMPDLTADDVGLVANLLCGSPPAERLSEDQAASLTPRLLRLARRLDQNADAYIQKLRDLVDRDLAATTVVTSRPKAVAVARSPREAATLARLHGMDEVVAWGMGVKTDVEDFKVGKITWADVDKGCLISGPPGCGKTLVARALAATCGIPLVSGSYSQWLGTGNAHQGDLLKAMKKTFSDSRAKTPCLLFIDEIDSFPNRATVSHHYAEWVIQVVNALLAEIDGVEGRDGVILIGACNHPEKLDPALIRSGRLDRHIRIQLPDRVALAKILREHLGNDLAGEDLSGAALAATGSTGADCERVVRGARRRARSAGREMITADLLDEIGGADEPSAEDLWVAAVHEAGHVVAACVLRPGGVEMVSLHSNLNRGGMASTKTPQSAYVRTNDVRDRLLLLLAGRAAEHETFGGPSSGAGGSHDSDLAQATKLAVTADAALGFDEEAGLVWRGVPEVHRLPGLLASDPRLADRVRQRLDAAYSAARDLIRPRLAAVHALGHVLVARRILDGSEAEAIVRCSLGDGGVHS